MRVRAPRALVLALIALLFAEVLAVLVYNLPVVDRPPTFVLLVDGWIQGSCYVTAAVVCLLRAAGRGPGSMIWWWLGLALTARAVAFVYYFSVVRLIVPQPYPSVSDGFWILTVVLMLGGLLALAWEQRADLTLGLALDGIIGILAAAAVTTALLYDTLVARAGAGRTSVVVTNMAYPLLDIALVLVLGGVLFAYTWHPPLPVWALAAGVLAFVVTDCVYLVMVTAGTFHPGTLLTPLTMLAGAVIGAAGWLPDGTQETPERELLPRVLVPALLAVTCLGVLVLASVHDVPRPAVVFAGLGVLTAIFRTGIAFKALRTLVEHGREARTDELTSLANRRSFNEVLDSSLHGRADHLPLSLLVVDLDNFKVVNDTLGHHHGDELLRLVAHRLQDGLREEDWLARIGGDEFAVVLDGASGELATHVAERLRAAMRRPFKLATRDVEVSASIGIAVFPKDGLLPGELLQHADMAMYEAKMTRSGHTLYRPEPHQADLARLESVDRIRRAIEDDEIVLHYQPVVSLVTGEVVSVEALCRWQHSTAGLLPPGGFLPLAESGGLMRSLTLEVLRQALRQAAAWKQEGTPLRVAVNMSVTNLLDVAFPEQLAMLLDGSGLTGHDLVLELTEDLFMADPSRARRVISDLRRLGVDLVVDDYGTGYSSLSYLRDLHEITGLKLDRSFITRVDHDPRAAAIVQSTLSLACSLGLTVVAEGVETTSERDRIASLGCELAQGFLFSPPVPAELMRFGVITDAQARRF